ncbi:MAG: Rne/Rng family ribonuclease [Lentisphaerae bacterium]|nr:Rne/Rng family ribonuclease [Lentisphaerota bacterium]
MFGFLMRKKAKRQIIINAESLQTRVAVLENGRLEEFQVEDPTRERVVGSIYKGRIQNLENDLQAAFVSIGQRKNAFLHYWDMLPDTAARIGLEDEEEKEKEKGKRRGRRARYTNEDIARQFPPGSEIVVQVTKGPIGTKGPRVTASLSLPGRYLVLMPGYGMSGVSRKIEDPKERERVRKILARLPLPDGTGIIVRTAASGARKSSFARDLRGLVNAWQDLQEAMRTRSAPACLYQEPDLGERVVRDWLTEDVDRVVVDTREEFEKIRDLAGKISRGARAKIQLYEGSLPIFDHYGVEHQLEEAMRRKVGLKSGGHITIDETEALIAIDVNTGRHKGKGSQEEAILEVNMEAVEEVARQLRLRNIGGLVVIDLIDMKPKKHQNAVYRAMREALRRDRARTNVIPISPLGIMEMTRQRVEESILATMYIDCPYCRGRGEVKSAMSMSVDIQRQISAAMRKHGKGQTPLELEIAVHPTVLDRLRREDEEFLLDIEERFGGRLTFRSEVGKHIEFFSIKNRQTGEMLFSTAEK